MLWILFIFVSFIGGLITSFSFENGVRILLLDVVVGIYTLSFLLFLSKRKEALQNYLSIFGPFIGVAALSIIISSVFVDWSKLHVSWLYLLRFIIYSLLTVSIGFNNQLKKNILHILWLNGVVLAILGLGQYFLYPNLRNLAYLGWDPHQYRVFSTLFDPNFTGMVLVLTLIIGVYQLILPQPKNAFYQKLLLLGFGLTGTALLLTYSRGSFVSLLASMTIFFVKRKKVRWLCVASAIFLLVLILLPRPAGEGVNLLRTISIDARIENSRAALDTFKQSPIFGNGNNLMTIHNGWLYLLSTTGMAGMLTYLWSWKKLLKTRGKTTQEIHHFELLLISLVAIGVHSIFDNSLFYPHIMFWMWTLVGTSLPAKAVS